MYNQDDKIELNTTPSIQRHIDQYNMEVGPTPELEKILKSSDNICEILDDTELTRIGDDLGDQINDDRLSMEPWLKKYKKAMGLARLEPKNAKKTFPFEGASNVMCPYILEAAIDFNARIVPGLIERKNICKSNITGKERDITVIVMPDGTEEEVPDDKAQKVQAMLQQGQQPQQGQEQPQQEQGQEQPQLKQVKSTEKQDMADRRTDVINWDLTIGIENWRDSKDKEMMVLPISGTTFRLNRQSAFENKRISTLIYPDKLICNHDMQNFSDDLTKSFEYAMNKNDVIAAMRTEQFKDFDLTSYKDADSIDFIESHTWIDLDDDNFKEPYIVTMMKDTNNIVSIVPRFDENDVRTSDGEVCKIKAEEFFTITIFLPDPIGGFMGMGWGILLADMFEIINTNTNQLIDGGTLQNIGQNSGFIRSGGGAGPRAGNRQKKGEINMQMGTFTTIESSGTNPLAQDIVNFPFAGPSPVLMQLLEGLKAEIREMTQAAGIEAMANESAEMYLARLQQALTIPNAINCRVLSGVTKEIKRISDIIGNYMGQDEYQKILNDPDADWTKDFNEGVFDISMTADPTQGNQQERIARATMIKQEAMQNPALDARFAYTKWFEAIGVQDPDEYLAPVEKGQPDPLQLMQAQAMQTMSEAEKLKGEADMIEAQVKMMEAQVRMSKLEPEIEKLEAETAKILSEIDSNQENSQLMAKKQMLDSLREQYKFIDKRLNDERNHSREDQRVIAGVRNRS